MLLKAEKILRRDDVIMNRSDREIFEMTREELVSKMIADCISAGVAKIEVANELDDDFGALVKVRVTLRVYNPDD